MVLRGPLRGRVGRRRTQFPTRAVRFAEQPSLSFLDQSKGGARCRVTTVRLAARHGDSRPPAPAAVRGLGSHPVPRVPIPGAPAVPARAAGRIRDGGAPLRPTAPTVAPRGTRPPVGPLARVGRGSAIPILGVAVPAVPGPRRGTAIAGHIPSTGPPLVAPGAVPVSVRIDSAAPVSRVVLAVRLSVRPVSAARTSRVVLGVPAVRVSVPTVSAAPTSRVVPAVRRTDPIASTAPAARSAVVA